MRALPMLVLIMALGLSLVGCQKDDEDRQAQEEAERQERKAREEREAQEEKEATRLSEERKARLRTMRVLGFVVLSGGAVILLVWTNRSSPQTDRTYGSTSLPNPTQWRDARQRPTRSRIIDIPPQPVRPSATPSAPYAGRQSSRNNRHTRNRT